MKNDVYFDNFTCLADVEREFEVKLGEEYEILLAVYTYGDYCGDALVIGKRGGTLFMVTAGHCSCYGLEGSWREDETSLEALKHMLEHGTVFSFLDMNGEVAKLLHRLGDGA